MSDERYAIFYWVLFDEIILVPIRVVGDFNTDEIDHDYLPKISLTNCIYIGEL